MALLITNVTRGPDPDVPARDILQFFEKSSDPGFTAREVADQFDKTRQWADNRLDDLVSAGYLDSKNPGGRSKWFWITPSGLQLLRGNNDT